MSVDLGEGTTDDDLEVAAVLANSEAGFPHCHHNSSGRHGKSITPSSSKPLASNPPRAATVMTNVSRWNTVTLTPCYIKESSIHVLAAFGETSQMKQDYGEGFDVNALDDQGMSPLMWACYFGQHETAAYLLDLGADTQISSTVNGGTALILAVVRESQSCLELLLNAGAETNCCCNEGNTPLHYAVNAKLPQFVGQLLEWGAQVMVPNKQGITPYEIAIKKRYTQIQKLMEQHMLTFPLT